MRKIVIPPDGRHGYRVRCIATVREYLIAAAVLLATAFIAWLAY